MTMMKSITAIALALSASVADAATKVAVLEYGEGGFVRRTNAENTVTTVDGVASFWGALHGNGRKLQHAGMSLVPDLFKKPENGIVIGISGNGLDLETLPFLSSLLNENSETVGTMDISGSRCNALMSKIPEWDEINASSIVEATKEKLGKKGLSGFKTLVDNVNSADIDQKVAGALDEIKAFAKSQGENIVVHLVIEEDEAVERRRRLSRSLEDEAADEENGGDQYDDAADQNGGDNKEYNGYYGYGYYNDYGEWVTPFKTMFQIQYFNVVLWTSIGLVVTLMFTIYLMVYMPMEADTLLFGESAKFVGDD